MTRSIAIVAALILGAAAPAAADRAALLPVSGVNVHEGYLAAAQQLARDHLEEHGLEVVVSTGAGDTIELGSAEAVEQGRAVAARFAVVVHVTRFGGSAKVKLTSYDVASGAVQFRGTLTAGTPDDLDAVMSRLAKGMATGEAPRDNAEIDTVTQKEADPYKKVRATSVRGVRISGLAVLHAPDGTDGAPGIGVFWLYDVRSFLADVALDFHSNEEVGDFTVALGAYYPFSRANTTPYLGGGLRYGFADYGGEGAWGISGYASVGLLFGRLSSVQLRGEAMVFQNLFREEERDDVDGSATRRRSTGLIVSAGLGF